MYIDHDVHLLDYLQSRLKNAKAIFECILKEKKKTKKVAAQLTNFEG